jgi:hypothetical protein
VGELTYDEQEKEHLLVGRILHHFMRAVYYNTHEITEVDRGYPFSELLIIGEFILFIGIDRPLRGGGVGGRRSRVYSFNLRSQKKYQHKVTLTCQSEFT